MNIHDIPILIPAKGESKRCPNKNLTLMPYMKQYLMQEGLFDNATIISSSDRIIECADNLGFNSFVEHDEPWPSDITAVRQYIKQNQSECFFMLELPQPFRSHGLLDNMYEMFQNTNVDFVASSQIVQDRTRFYVKDNQFEYRYKKHSGASCGLHEMIDGAAYLIKSEFFINCNDFWSGRFCTVLNGAPFLDIDTEKHMSDFNFLKSYFL